MRKILLIILSFVLIAGLCACNRTVTGYDGLIGKAREEINMADADTIEITIAGTTDTGRRSLVWFITGDQYQAHEYFPMEFEIAKNDNSKFKFVKAYKALDRGTDIAVLQWNNGYCFLINNENCKTLKISEADGSTESIEVSKYPYWDYYESAQSNFEYQFLDENGNEIT